MLTGMKDNGCYITLLEEGGLSTNVDDNLLIAEGFIINDIYYNEIDNKLILSCGYKGILILDWFGEDLSVINFNNWVASSYAYSARIIENVLFVATKTNASISNCI